MGLSGQGTRGMEEDKRGVRVASHALLCIDDASAETAPVCAELKRNIDCDQNMGLVWYGREEVGRWLGDKLEWKFEALATVHATFSKEAVQAAYERALAATQ